jgi:Ala-tRNA(Pro) deacylase
MDQTVFDRLQAWLSQKGIQFTVLRHEPVFTSEQAAIIRGTSLASGAKALIVKAAEEFILLVLPADRKLDSRQVRTALGIKSLRFATKEEVFQLTGLQPGSIPPFGSLFRLQTYCDPELGKNEMINFNAGDHAISIKMNLKDFLEIEKPKMIHMTATPGGAD